MLQHSTTRSPPPRSPAIHFPAFTPSRCLLRHDPLPQQTWIDETPCVTVAPEMLSIHVKSGMNSLPQQTWIDEITPARKIACRKCCSFMSHHRSQTSTLTPPQLNFPNACTHQRRPHVLLFALGLPTSGFTSQSGVPFLECFEVFHKGSFASWPQCAPRDLNVRKPLDSPGCCRA